MSSGSDHDRTQGSRPGSSGPARPRWVYALAVVSSLVSVGLKVLLGDYLAAPYLLPMASVLLSASVGGLGPGAVATLLSAALVYLTLFEPVFTLYLDHPRDLIGLTVFAVVGLAVSVIADRLRNAESRASRQAEELQIALAAKAVTEEKFRALIEKSSDVIMVLDEKGMFTFVSPSFEALTGMAPERTLGRSAFDFTHPDDTPRAIEALDAALRAPASTKHARVRVRRADGSWAYLDASVTNMLAVPAVRGIVVNNRDVSEGAAAEQALRVSEARLALAVRGGRLGLWDWDLRTGRCTYNERWASMLGYTLDEIEPSASVWEKLLHPDDKARIQPILEANMRGEASSWAWEQRLRHKDGHWVWILGSGAVVERAPDGTPLRAAGTHADISDRKAAEKALRESEEKYRSLVENLHAGVVVHAPDSSITFCNAHASQILGLSAEQLQGREAVDPAWRFVREDGSTMPVSEYPVSRVIASGAPVVNQVVGTERPLTGDRAWALVNAYPTRNENGALERVVVTFVEITERTVAEAALRESERLLLQSQKIAQIGSYAFDIPADCWSSSPTLEEIFGIDEGHPRKASDWLQIVHPEDREAMGLYLADLLARGSRFDREYRVVNRRSGKTRWVHGLGELERGPGGEPVRLIGTIHDVTAHKAADVERDVLQAKLSMSQRLAAMGTLVSGVAHEINNPLAADMAGEGVALEEARSLRSRFDDPAPLDREAGRRHLDVIVEALEDATEGSARIARIVKDLAAFANPDPNRTLLRLPDVVSTAVRWIPKVLAQGADIRVEEGDAPSVLASAGQIEQVVVNLVTNAAKATPSGRHGDILVRIGPGNPGMARIEVIDQGSGIAPEIRERIFEPFFTTRRAGVGRGTGLGLAICHAIVSDHGGTITVQSEVGKGSTFRVELPAAPAEA